MPDDLEDGLALCLSIRERAFEMQTLERIGCRRFTVTSLYVTELVTILLASAILTAGALVAVNWLLPQWFHLV